MTVVDNRARNRLLLVLFTGVLMGALDIAIVGPALPAIQAHFGVDDRAIAWIFTIYVLFNMIGTPLMAKLSDIFGRRSVYVLNVVLFALGSIVVALSPTFAVLLAGRAIQGLGGGGIFPVAIAVIGDTFPAEKRGSALGLIGAVFGLAFVIGPILGGVLLIFGWEWLFLVNVPIALAVVAASLRLLPATRPAQRRPFDWPGMLALEAMLTGLAVGINRIDTTHFMASITSAEVWPFLAAAVLLIPVFGWAERRAADPILRLELFDSRQVVVVSALSAGTGLAEGGLVFVPALVVAAFQVTTSTASFMLVPVVLTMIVGAPLAGRLLDRTGSKVVVVSGTVLLTAGLIGLSLFATRLLLMYLSGALIGLGLSSLLGAPLRYIMLNEAPVRDRAAAQGALSLFTRIGQLISGALVGAIAASRGGGVAGYQAAYLVVGVIMGLLVLLALALKGRAEEVATVERNEQVHALEVAEPVLTGQPHHV